MNHSDIVIEAEAYVRHIFDEKIPSNIYLYHNWEHTCHVRDEVNYLARLAHVSNEELEMLNLATLFHDAGFSETFTGHEEVGAQLAKSFLSEKGYPEEKIETITGLILATRIETEPKNHLEKLIKDADTSSLGKPQFSIVTNTLRKELNALQQANYSSSEWTLANLKFLNEHRYYSDIGKAKYDKPKLENKRLLEEEVERLEERKSEAAEGNYTIGTSRSAQTQFKTALRNHIDLSSIADNKANIMLSVNALIITFALPLLGKEITSNRMLLIPTILLLIVCLVSMIFATLATKPIPMKGYSSMESILQKKSNLFFFGNFYRMSFQEYREGMDATIADDSILDTTIMRDLFFLGKTLGAKYSYLRKCYTIFMYGIIVTVTAFMVVFVFS